MVLPGQLPTCCESPVRWLKMVDLPTLGCPARAMTAAFSPGAALIATPPPAEWQEPVRFMAIPHLAFFDPGAALRHHQDLCRLPPSQGNARAPHQDDHRP